MKITDRKKEIASSAAVVLLSLLLLGLTYFLFYLRNLTNRDDGVPFDLAMLTADRDADMTDISKYLLPEFIGITAEDGRWGLSGSVNTVVRQRKVGRIFRSRRIGIYQVSLHTPR